MAYEYIYLGKPLSAYSLWELGTIEQSLKQAEARREEAKQHPKFQKMSMPPPNPEFLKLKNAIEEEIKRRNSNA